MSFTTDLIANLRYQLQTMNVDSDPSLPWLTIEVSRDTRNGRFQGAKIHRISTHHAAPMGVIVREALDNPDG